jgi:nucleoside-diphosphate-sugar epimerase
MRGRRVVVTGASGFVGGRVARALEAAGATVLCFGRRPASALASPLPQYASWDLAAGPRALGPVDAVVHCAAHVAQWGAARTFAEVNERGTQHLLASLEMPTPVVYVSTASVYDGARSPRRLPPYAATKQRAEQLVQQSGHPSVVLRPHVIYGPGDTTLWPRVRAAVRGGVLRVPGTGEGAISVTHVDNLVHAIERALAVLGDGEASLPPFDIADAHAPRVAELLRTVFARQAEPVRLRFVPEPMALGVAVVSEAVWQLFRRSGEPPLTRYVVRQLARPSVLDIRPAQRLLDYAPRCDYRTGPL